MGDEFTGMEQLIKRVGELALDTRRVERPLRAAGEIAVASIHKNFEEQGRPQKWTPLSPGTLAGRRKGRGSGGPQILIDRARLKNSIGAKVHLALPDSNVEVGTNVRYAARQHFGYQGTYSGKKPRWSGARTRLLGYARGKSHTPARPFLMLQHEDYGKIERVFSRHIAKR